MQFKISIGLVFPIIALFACSTNPVEEEPIPTTAHAKVLSVSVTGDENNYTFSVTIESPDTGCDQYADWWEVFDEGGTLIYRRILAHSHVTEQPFTRSGGAVEIAPDQVVWVRAHMNNLGYGNEVMKGTVEAGFEQVELEADFAAELATQAPLPGECIF